MACCENPRPKILEKNGRLFCQSCRRYLDQPRELQAPIPETPPPDVVVEQKEDDRVVRDYANEDGS